MRELILAIESSCDDSCVAIMDKRSFKPVFERKISQEKEHFKFGGVVPELAARLHTKALLDILELTKPYFSKLCAVSVTSEPGLSVSLVSGITMAKTLALSLNLPLIAVNHLAGHFYSLFLEQEACFDMGVLLVSGGHTLCFKLDEKGAVSVLAQSLDDSFGESFDKVAKMMSLGYPGGVVVENLALKAVQKNVHFSLPMLHSKEPDFSFSGLKNAVRLEILKHERLDEGLKSEIAYAFEECATAHLLNKLEKIFSTQRFKKFGVVGGASANLKLRAKLEALCKKYECELLLAPLKYCSDNALMIARAACAMYDKGVFVDIKDDILSPKNRHFERIY